MLVEGHASSEWIVRSSMCVVFTEGRGHPGGCLGGPLVEDVIRTTRHASARSNGARKSPSLVAPDKQGPMDVR
eukprot:1964424-Alexandrium_andersonii.AAC.1